MATFKDEAFFSRTDSPICIVEDTKVYLDLPKMYMSEEQEKIIKIAQNTIEATTHNLVLGQVILTILLAISLKQMWNLLNVI